MASAHWELDGADTAPTRLTASLTAGDRYQCQITSLSGTNDTARVRVAESTSQPLIHPATPAASFGLWDTFVLVVPDSGFIWGWVTNASAATIHYVQEQ